MIPELGLFSQIVGLGMAIALTLIPAWGAWRGHQASMQLGPGLAAGMTFFITLSFICLSIAFVQDDFSVALVANNSNTLLPMVYKLCAVFGNHEGSMLLWSLILCLWTLAVAIFSPSLPLVFKARVLSVMGAIAVGFLSFSLFTSNPFARLLPGIPAEGSDLNPLLQDPGMIIHPPLLYIGYAGFSVAFAFAIAALLGGRLDAAWARWSRPWTNVAWAFLSLGIMLGSWWAYYELGWGGWWFWDPVENASFMPWLAGTALIHSLAVTEKRGLFKSWTVLLAIFAFSLCLLGTFLVRSGVITSVHAFANDPERGVFILVFLAIVVGGSLTLYALRAPAVASRVTFAWVSRESLLLLNNVVFLVATLTVLFGTLFPLLMDALGGGKYSVGPPYFNAVFVPLMALLVPFMGVGPISRWKKDTPARWRSELLLPLAVAVVCALTLPLFGADYNLWVALAVLLAGWLVFGLARDCWNRVKTASDIGRGFRRLPASYWGMVTAHLGFAACIVGVVATSQYSVEHDLKMQPGDVETVAGYEFRFVEVAPVRGPNYVADEARFEVSRDGKFVARLAPQKRRYLAGGSIMTEAAIDPGLFRDLYVAMGEPIGADGAWAIRLHYKPMVRWMWLGAILMALGGFTTVADKRYRTRRAVTAPVSGAQYAG
ncbi:c-type cytochrome biogenesis protein CcmF [Halioglobus japonicus]|uniref:Heme lyase CcmF/NrfE family subunit n=1 Tax=Halioglobus japonicus TaxID=930805 RepID=A0AAP8MFE2_9GAMM|nr:heme lyase CcmF/NrfE family subunit [Halioglobus japonicus]AQA18814.1 c-type cytochrome biogenesis protein CcmF [Halioglobus japonicus]PLW86846.1 heme lyase CcmF/NrfE family subunit [Halioglobus japonicus]GHD23750.1 cytochrome c-type biogenesis protein CcmF [Halioglobus japonicus]